MYFKAGYVLMNLLFRKLRRRRKEKLIKIKQNFWIKYIWKEKNLGLIMKN